MQRGFWHAGTKLHRRENRNDPTRSRPCREKAIRAFLIIAAIASIGLTSCQSHQEISVTDDERCLSEDSSGGSSYADCRASLDYHLNPPTPSFPTPSLPTLPPLSRLVPQNEQEYWEEFWRILSVLPLALMH